MTINFFFIMLAETVTYFNNKILLNYKKEHSHIHNNMDKPKKQNNDIRFVQKSR